MTKNSMRKMCVVAGLLVGSVVAQAINYDAQIMIDRALNSPTLTVRYTGAHAALVELRVNGESLGTRSMTASKDAGETHFSLNLEDLKDGDNDVEIRLFDRTGKLVGSDRTNISNEQTLNTPVFLTTPKIGQTVTGSVDIKLGFGQTLKGVYVSFFVDNDFKAMSNVAPYEFTWDSSREHNGWHEIEAWAIDGASTTYKTRKVKVLVNNPGGHTPRYGVSSDATPVKNPTVVGLGGGGEIDHMRSGHSRSGQIATDDQLGGVPPKLSPSGASANPLHAEPVNAIVNGKPVWAPKGVSTGVRDLFPTARHDSGSANAKSGAIHSQIRNVTAISTAFVPTKRVGDIEIRRSAGMVAQSFRGLPPTSVLHEVANASNLLQINRGQHIPNLGSFAVILNSQFVNFDVPTRVDDGIPMAPFRYLIEKSGGNVDWDNLDKSLNAQADGHDIYLHIGDKDAKINNMNVTLDLAPYIDRGRTIVPISFMKSALNVDVEYDKTTGHVLITKTKQ